MPAIACGHGVVSGSAAFWASCAAAAPVIAANANSATVILACCMRFPLVRFALPSLTGPSLLETNEITRSRIRNWDRRSENGNHFEGECAIIPRPALSMPRVPASRSRGPLRGRRRWKAQLRRRLHIEGLAFAAELERRMGGVGADVTEQPFNGRKISVWRKPDRCGPGSHVTQQFAGIAWINGCHRGRAVQPLSHHFEIFRIDRAEKVSLTTRHHVSTRNTPTVR